MSRRHIGCIIGFLLLAGGFPATAEPIRTTPSIIQKKTFEPSDEEVQQALHLVNDFVECVRREDFVRAFGYVRGIDDPKAATDRMLERVRDNIAANAFRDLMTCETNLEMIGSAVEGYSRAHQWMPPRSLNDLIRSALLIEMPRCPAGGRYVYANGREGPFVVCSRDAHREIGVRGDFPSLSARDGLSIGEQKLSFDQTVDFTVERFSTSVAGFQPDFNTLWIYLDEVSSIRGEPARPRKGVFGLSRSDGIWKIDLFLTNADLNSTFDMDKWRVETAIAKQVLYILLRAQPGQHPNDAERGRAKLLLRVCESNLRILAVALEGVSVRLNGRYPSTAPLYRVLHRRPQVLPVCPAGGKYRYRSDASGYKYVIDCQGHAHAEADVPANLPSVDPVLGVIRAHPDAPP